MLKNLIVLLNSRNMTQIQTSCIIKYKALYTQKNEFKYLSTSVSNHSVSALPLSYDAFVPEGQPASQVPVIILHGLLGSKKNWRGLGKAICIKNKRKVFTLDARNHGESPSSADFDYPLMVGDVKYFMVSQSIPEAVIIGHSMGGRTAMLLALSNQKLVDKLIVVDVSPTNMPQQSKLIPEYMRFMKEALPSVHNMGLVEGRAAINEFLSKTIPEEFIRQFLLTNLTEKNKILSWKPNINVLLEKFDSNIMAFPSINHHYSGDTLFVCGGDSPFVKPDDHPSIKALFPKAEFVTIPNAGHWVHSEKPSEFLQTVHEFL